MRTAFCTCWAKPEFVFLEQLGQMPIFCCAHCHHCGIYACQRRRSLPVIRRPVRLQGLQLRSSPGDDSEPGGVRISLALLLCSSVALLLSRSLALSLAQTAPRLSGPEGAGAADEDAAAERARGLAHHAALPRQPTPPAPKPFSHAPVHFAERTAGGGTQQLTECAHTTSPPTSIARIS